MQTDNGTPVDLTNCDREPIHLPGSVQPFGFLLAVSSTTWCVARTSRNVVEWLGVEAADLLGRPLDQIFTPDAVHTIRGQLQSAIMGDTVARAFGVVLTGAGLRCDVAMHVMHDTVVIEGEPCVDDPAINAGAMVRGVGTRVFWVQTGGSDTHSGQGAAGAGAYSTLMGTVRELAEHGLSASVLTQITDVEVEMNGLVTYDRAVVKVDEALSRRLNDEIIRAGS